MIQNETESGRQTRPNIILILVDDMGYSDIGCFGSEIPTPNLDRLAAGGVRFSQTYNCARCCRSRASLLTGLYPHKAGMGHMLQPLDHHPLARLRRARPRQPRNQSPGRYPRDAAGGSRRGVPRTPRGDRASEARRAELPAPVAGSGLGQEHPLFFEHEGNCAVRAGRWKLVRQHNQPWELFDMVDDRTELRDLAERQADRVEQMESQYRIWADSCGVLPFEQARALPRRT